MEKFDTIGNLLVISRHSNSEFGNKSTQEKIDLINNDKKHFGNLRYMDEFLEKYSDKFENWSLEDIDERSLDFAKDAYQNTWKY